ATRNELAELERRELAYRGHRPRPQIGGRVVILVDDGLATGASMIAALRALRPLGPRRLVVAVPTAPPDACAEVAAIADELVCPLTPRPFLSVGQWYEDFAQTSDEEVRTLLTS
ncbi:MAG: phosphoribosyltransferase, partial [Candidatus Dormibacteraeota bacterium]|nr:phosphoribosyltransferase [Candidatus Dormibacteraeota bacterium]